MGRAPWRRDRNPAKKGESRSFTPVRNPAPIKTFERTMLGQHDPTTHTAPSTTPSSRRGPGRKARVQRKGKSVQFKAASLRRRSRRK